MASSRTQCVTPCWVSIINGLNSTQIVWAGCDLVGSSTPTEEVHHFPFPHFKRLGGWEGGGGKGKSGMHDVEGGCRLSGEVPCMDVPCWRWLLQTKC